MLEYIRRNKEIAAVASLVVVLLGGTIAASDPLGAETDSIIKREDWSTEENHSFSMMVDHGNGLSSTTTSSTVERHSGSDYREE